ncbi:polyketide synthase dehydratase domain-containing protein, partial [Fulvivirga kasyanovii]
PLRVPLPGYVFEGAHYWLPAVGEAAPSAPATTSLGSYEVSYHHGEPYLRDHVTFGEQVLLGVTHCSLAIDAVRRHREGSDQLRLDKVLFESAVIVGSGKDANVRVSLQESSKGLSFESHYRTGSMSVWEKSAGGAISFESGPRPSRFDLEGFKNSSDYEVSGEELYTLKKPGVYGPGLKTVEKAYIKGGEVLGELCLRPEMEDDERNYYLHPALLDGSMVTRFALLDDSGSPEPFIPVMIKSLVVYEVPGAHSYSHVVPVKSNDEVWIVDISIMDATGAIQVELKGFT